MLTKWPTIPIEVEPLAIAAVLSSLRDLGSSDPTVRAGAQEKTGPIKTDQDNFIIDAPFPSLLLPKDTEGTHSSQSEGERTKGNGKEGVWEVQKLAREIKLIEGVLSVGIFSGQNGEEAAAKGLHIGGQKPVAAYFGMQDGSVVVRKAGDSA